MRAMFAGTQENGLTPEYFGREDVELKEDRIAFDGFWKLAVLRLRHRLFAGGWSAELTRELHRRGQAVGVLLYDPAIDCIGLVEQFRVGALDNPAGPWLLELVAGLLEKGETPAMVARRESIEEAGCRLDAIEPIADYYSSPGGSDEYFYLFCGRTDLSGVEVLHGVDHEHEDIRLHVIPWGELADVLSQGRCNNAHTLLALEWFNANRLRLRGVWCE